MRTVLLQLAFADGADHGRDTAKEKQWDGVCEVLAVRLKAQAYPAFSMSPRFPDGLFTYLSKDSNVCMTLPLPTEVDPLDIPVLTYRCVKGTLHLS